MKYIFKNVYICITLITTLVVSLFFFACEASSVATAPSEGGVPASASASDSSRISHQIAQSDFTAPGLVLAQTKSTDQTQSADVDDLAALVQSIDTTDVSLYTAAFDLKDKNFGAGPAGVNTSLYFYSVLIKLIQNLPQYMLNKIPDSLALVKDGTLHHYQNDDSIFGYNVDTGDDGHVYLSLKGVNGLFSNSPYSRFLYTWTGSFNRPESYKVFFGYLGSKGSKNLLVNAEKTTNGEVTMSLSITERSPAVRSLSVAYNLRKTTNLPYNAQNDNAYVIKYSVNSGEGGPTYYRESFVANAQFGANQAITLGLTKPNLMQIIYSTQNTAQVLNQQLTPAPKDATYELRNNVFIETAANSNVSILNKTDLPASPKAIDPMVDTSNLTQYETDVLNIYEPSYLSATK